MSTVGGKVVIAMLVVSFANIAFSNHQERILVSHNLHFACACKYSLFIVVKHVPFCEYFWKPQKWSGLIEMIVFLTQPNANVLGNYLQNFVSGNLQDSQLAQLQQQFFTQVYPNISPEFLLNLLSWYGNVTGQANGIVVRKKERQILNHSIKQVKYGNLWCWIYYRSNTERQWWKWEK